MQHFIKSFVKLKKLCALISIIAIMRNKTKTSVVNEVQIANVFAMAKEMEFIF